MKSIWFRAELNFCPKIVASRQECIAKKEVWERRSHTKHKGRLWFACKNYHTGSSCFTLALWCYTGEKIVIYSFMLLQVLHVEIEMKIFKERY